MTRLQTFMTSRTDRLKLPGSGSAAQNLVDGDDDVDEPTTRPIFSTLADEGGSGAGGSGGGDGDEVVPSLGSRVTFSEESVALETGSRLGRGSSRTIAELTEETVKEDVREGWDSHMQ